MHPVSPLILVMCKTGTFQSRRDVVSHDGDVIFGRHNIHIITNRVFFAGTAKKTRVNYRKYSAERRPKKV